MNDLAIKVEGVSKSFELPHEKHGSVKSLFVNFYRRRSYETLQALQAVSFEVNKGEFFGIVGRNGSGKSTLLKLLAGIYTPTSGDIQINGKLTPFIELGVGFNPELTGRENVYLNGALLGFTRKEMRLMYKDIVEFAELPKFMDQKLKNYSSGMQVRLAFSIAIRAQSDILLIDEVLAVGDLDFQKKCYNHFSNLKRGSQTVVFVSHDMAAIRRFCNRCALISSGALIKVGDPDEVADMYEEENLRLAENRMGGGKIFKKREGTKEATISQVETFDSKSGKVQNTFKPSEKIGVRIKFKTGKDIKNPSVGFIFQNQEDLTVFATNNHVVGQNTGVFKAGQQMVMESIIDNVFTDGEYTITCAIESDDFSIIYDRIEYTHKFMIGGRKLSHALIHPSQTMGIKYSGKK